MNTFFDTHAHLDFPDFNDDLGEVIDRAIAAGISRILTIGTDADSSRKAIAIAELYPCVHAAVGWHPSHVNTAPPDVRPLFRNLARHPKVAAIGEIGLDYHRLPSRSPGGNLSDDQRYQKRQATLFQQQLELAAELNLNVVVHQRDAFNDVLAQMHPWASTVRGVFHCFGGSPAEASQVFALGSLVSFTGIVTFKNAAIVRESAAAAPSDRFMLETDCPYLAPVPHRGKRCEPAYVREIAQTIADARGCSLDELSAVTSRNAEQFFRNLQPTPTSNA
jgi:TatD DNase family protein